MVKHRAGQADKAPEHARSRARAAVVGLLWLAALRTAPLHADTLDQVEVRAEGANSVIRIGFTVRIQYLRHVSSESGDLLQIFFQIVSDPDRPTAVEEFRKTKASELSAAFTVTYPLQPAAVAKRVLVRFARPVSLRVRPGSDRSSIEIVLVGAAAGLRAPAAAPAGSAAERPARYAIALETLATPDNGKAVPAELGDYAVFISEVTRNGLTRYQLMLGYFSTVDAADRVRRRVLQQFPNAAVVELSAANAATEARRPAPARQPAGSPASEAPAAVPPVQQPSAPAAPPAPAAPSVEPSAVASEVDAQADLLFAQGRKALAAGDYAAATDAFNRLLVLPPNRYSQQAQELVGQAREEAGETDKARAEYELYLKLYPDGEGAQRVRRRLAALGGAPAQRTDRERPSARARRRTAAGSISQYYYDGRTKQQTAFNTPTTVDRATLSSRDLSSLVTNVDLNAAYRSDRAQTRLVVRDTYQHSFLSSNPSENRLNAAYVDYRGLQVPILFRAGRQTAVAGGINGRFDGVVAGWAFTPQFQLRAVGGVPVEYDVDSSRYFYGVNLEVIGLADRWSGNLFAIDQMVDGISDRRAVGGELRYFDSVRTLYTLLDYDVSYEQFNIAMLQGTWQTPGNTVFNLLLDRRKAPTLTTTNAVIGAPTTSIDALLRTMSEDQIRQRALALTADVTQGLASVTTPLSRRWQIGADFRVVNVGALPAVDDIPATPATGDIYAYTFQLIGNNLYSMRDINVFNATYQTGPTFYGTFLSYSNVTALNAKWTLEPALRYYTQQDDLGVRLHRIAPSVRLTYRLRERLALESEYTFEKSRTTGATQQDDVEQHFFSVGYRWDF